MEAMAIDRPREFIFGGLFRLRGFGCGLFRHGEPQG
jgi:hypothetical protein